MPHDLNPSSNPWLSLPLADYEGHMALLDIRQLLIGAEMAARYTFKGGDVLSPPPLNQTFVHHAQP